MLYIAKDVLDNANKNKLKKGKNRTSNPPFFSYYKFTFFLNFCPPPKKINKKKKGLMLCDLFKVCACTENEGGEG